MHTSTENVHKQELGQTSHNHTKAHMQSNRTVITSLWKYGSCLVQRRASKDRQMEIATANPLSQKNWKCSLSAFSPPAFPLTQWPLGRQKDCWFLFLAVWFSSSFFYASPPQSSCFCFDFLSPITILFDIQVLLSLREMEGWWRHWWWGCLCAPITEEKTAEEAEETNFSPIWYQILLNGPGLSVKVNWG